MATVKKQSGKTAKVKTKLNSNPKQKGNAKGIR